jgi:hypothetical protein
LIIGWIRRMRSIERICFTVSGAIAARTRIVSRMIDQP